MLNAHFNDYYKTQAIVQTNEWSRFEECLNKPLPITFRVSKHTDERIMDMLLNHFTPLLRSEANLTLESIDWYPNKRCWQLDCSRPQLRSMARQQEICRQFFDFLVSETATGNLSRQEVVSMIPPLLLNVNPIHKVLDMCASPGSKTTQILEEFEERTKQRNYLELVNSDGLIIANDSDLQRAFTLVHQCNRIGSPSLVVTCHNAQWFPHIPIEETHELETFDRILCDVPCSGDGTIRKCPEIRRMWNVGKSLSLHSTQVALAFRAACLLKVGGYMVYSTCSMNPIENEAVVSEVIKKCDYSVEVCSISDSIQHFRPGLTNWKVGWTKSQNRKKKSCNANQPEIQWFDNIEEVPANLAKDRIFPSMFPPQETRIRNQLLLCKRFLPHDKNTGGFFVAVFRKVSSVLTVQNYESRLRSTPPIGYVCHKCGLEGHYIDRCNFHEARPSVSSSEYSMNQESNSKFRKCPFVSCHRHFSDSFSLKRHIIFHREQNDSIGCSLHGNDLEVENCEQFSPLSTEHQDNIREFYGLSDDFPMEQLYTGSKNAANVFFVSKLVSRSCFKGGLKIINPGLRVLERDNSKLPFFRLSQIGMRFMLQYVTKRYLTVSLYNFEWILNSKNQSKANSTKYEELPSDLQHAFIPYKQGPLVVGISKSCKDALPYALSLFLGKKNCTILLSKERSAQMMRQFEQLRREENRE